MFYLVLCFSVFLGAYLINILYISVFYHRGLTHRAVTLKRGFAVSLFTLETGLPA